MENVHKPKTAFPVVAVGGAVSAAVTTGLGLTAAALSCQWSAGGNGADWWHLAFIYVNQSMIVLWLLVLPAVTGGRRTGVFVKSGASPVGLAAGVWLAAATAAVPAYIVAAWMSQMAWATICTLLAIQGVMALFSMAAGAWLAHVSAIGRVYVIGLLGALAIGGPILIYLQAEFFPNHAAGWRWFVSAFQIVRAAQTMQSGTLFWGIAVYGLCGLCGLMAAAAFDVGAKRSVESQA